MSHVEHVLEKPDSYVGSTEIEEIELDVFNDNNEDNIPKIEKRTFNYCPAFYKCFDELLVNAFDHSKRQMKKINDGDKTAIKVGNIKVEIDKENKCISVWNDFCYITNFN